MGAREQAVPAIGTKAPMAGQDDLPALERRRRNAPGQSEGHVIDMTWIGDDGDEQDTEFERY
jgi:hypothetical protein